MDAVSTNLPCEDDAALAAILSVLRDKTGVDFSCYRRPTITRRVRNRMVSVGASTLPAYLEMIHASDEEAAALLDRITIKVSRFYRNAAIFDRIRGQVLPSLAGRAGAGPLSAWSAGCGRGEEAYTLALLMEDAGMAGEVLATDIDRSALAAAAEGVYPEAALQELPIALRERYLERVPGKAPRWRVAERVRGRVSFAVADVAEAPRSSPPRFDLVCCRNVLIYLDRGAQQRALARVVASVVPEGYVVLGEAEWPPPDAMLELGVICPRQRIFQARPRHRAAA